MRRPVALVIGLLLVTGLWLAFRPELLFIHKSVDDPFPTSAATSAAAQP